MRAKQLTSVIPKHRDRFFALFEGGAEREGACGLSDGFEWRRCSRKKLFLCRGRNRFAEEQTTMAMDDQRASDDGYGCGGEVGGSGRFVCSLRVELQPPKDEVWMIVMVEMSAKKLCDGF